MRQLEDIYLALLSSSGTFTIDNSEAAEATLAINPEFVIPMHRRDSDSEEFKKRVESFCSSPGKNTSFIERLKTAENQPLQKYRMKSKS